MGEPLNTKVLYDGNAVAAVLFEATLTGLTLTVFFKDNTVFSYTLDWSEIDRMLGGLIHGL